VIEAATRAVGLDGVPLVAGRSLVAGPELTELAVAGERVLSA
jgi:hypothetical protein